MHINEIEREFTAIQLQDWLTSQGAELKISAAGPLILASASRTFRHENGYQSSGIHVEAEGPDIDDVIYTLMIKWERSIEEHGYENRVNPVRDPMLPHADSKED